MPTPYDIASTAPRNVHFHLEPRYTSGSPAMVDLWTCTHVANDEKAAYERRLDGVYGTGWQDDAMTRGLSGIAYARWEKGKKVWRLDLLTGQTFIEPPHLDYKEKDRMKDLRNRQQYVGLRREDKLELEDLEYRLTIHRETI